MTTILKTGRLFTLSWMATTLAFAVGCKADPPASAKQAGFASSTPVRGVIAGWEPIPLRPDSSNPPAKSSPAEDGLYWSALKSLVLPDETITKPVMLASTDETDVTNAQGASMRLGRDADADAGRPVFSVDFTRFSSGVLIMTLERSPVGQAAENLPDIIKPSDSIAVAGLAPTERVASECRLGLRSRNELLMGVVPDSSRMHWMRPRLAWLVDTVSSRFRRIRPDSVSCLIWEDPD
jgi:hypothetical protein